MNLLVLRPYKILTVPQQEAESQTLQGLYEFYGTLDLLCTTSPFTQRGIGVPKPPFHQWHTGQRLMPILYIKKKVKPSPCA